MLEHRLQQGPTVYLLAVQVHQEGYPSVEHAEKEWPRPFGDDSYIPIAKVTIPQKEKDKEFLPPDLCETLSFNPGHSPPEHRGIGGLQRARSLIYAAVETKRNLARKTPDTVKTL